MINIAVTENEQRTESLAYHAILRHLLFILSLCLFIVPSAWGDYQDGRTAYNRGDYETALKELRPLAEQGHPEAQYFVGYMYYKGQGVAQNGAEAVKWLRKAAEQGDVKAQLRLGMMFRLGLTVPKNYAEAEKWLLKATEQGDAKARYNLGLMYYRGEGVDQDEVEGLELIRKADEQGYASAQTFLSQMNERLSQMGKIDAPQKNFQILWDDYNRYYVFFESKMSIGKLCMTSTRHKSPTRRIMLRFLVFYLQC